MARLAAAPGSRLVPFIFSSWSGDPNVELPRALGAGGDGLEEALERRTGAMDGTLLVILDQFEEFFQYHQGTPEGARFADELARCVQRNDLRAHFLVSIREDAYSRLGDEFKGRLPNVYSNYLHLDDLDERGARAAIEEPLRHVGNGSASIEPALVDRGAPRRPARRGLERPLPATRRPTCSTSCGGCGTRRPSAARRSCGWRRSSSSGARRRSSSATSTRPWPASAPPSRTRSPGRSASS